MKRLAWIFAGALAAWAQGPAVTPLVVPTFTYTMNSGTYPAAQTVKVTLPTAVATLPIVVTNIQVAAVDCVALFPPVPPPCGWLAVTPDQGHSPLSLTVSVNPTGLAPGNYPGSFLVDTSPSSGAAVKVTVNLQIVNPPSRLLVSSQSANFLQSNTGDSAGSLFFTYTTGADQSTLATSEVDVSSTGDIIPFNVTVANAKGGTGGSSTSAVWLRVSSTSYSQGAALATSGSAGVGSLVPIFVTIDYPTLQSLGIGQYYATISVTSALANSKTNTPQTVTVSLVVSAGAPTVSSVFPQSVVPSPPTDPIFSIYGSNFTLNTSVFLIVNGVSKQITTDRLTLVSPKLLQARIPAGFLGPQPFYPALCTLSVQNGGFPAVTGAFLLTDPSAPSISLVVNAASYQPLSKFLGSAADPAAGNPPTAVSPRGVISIFGQNLGPAIVSSATPILTPSAACPTGNCYDTTWAGITVTFGYTDPKAGMTFVNAPILMASVNQINCIVPKEVAVMAGTATPVALVQVWNNGLSSLTYNVTVLKQDPGIFTFGGLGQGQGAIINYDANGAATINSSTNQEPRGDIIAIFASGLGEVDPAIPNGALTSATAPGTQLQDAGTVMVYIGGQPAVVLYAGTSPGAVAGLVQVNAIVPPTSSTGTNVPITLAIGDPTVVRQAQSGVTVAVKK